MPRLPSRSERSISNHWMQQVSSKSRSKCSISIHIIKWFVKDHLFYNIIDNLHKNVSKTQIVKMDSSAYHRKYTGKTASNSGFISHLISFCQQPSYNLTRSMVQYQCISTEEWESYTLTFRNMKFKNKNRFWNRSLAYPWFME